LFADEQVTSLSSGGNTLWALSDHLGSIRDIADLNEGTGVTTVTNHRTPTATGKIVSETNTAVDLLFAFTGKQFDEATGLQHNLFRWYDTSLGKWMSEDPIGFAAHDTNLSRYVSNRTLQNTDKTGLEDDEETSKATKALIAHMRNLILKGEYYPVLILPTAPPPKFDWLPGGPLFPTLPPPLPIPLDPKKMELEINKIRFALPGGGVGELKIDPPYKVLGESLRQSILQQHLKWESPDGKPFKILEIRTEWSF
jgi:RHS repeat-associated protein